MLEVIQHNCRRSGDSFTLLMQWADRKKADCILIQEPPVYKGYSQHGYEIVWGGRVATAVRLDSMYSFSFSHRWTGECEGDALVCSAERKRRIGSVSEGKKSEKFVIINLYLAPVFGARTNRDQRPGSKLLWREALERDNGIIAGDFNCHSKRWDNKRETEDQDRWTKWTEDLIDTHELTIANNGDYTYYKDNSEYSSAMDLTLAGSMVEICDWKICSEDEADTGSDHEIIQFGVREDQGTATLRTTEEEYMPSRGWKIAEMIASPTKMAETEAMWNEEIGKTPMVQKKASRKEIEEQAAAIQESMIRVLDRHAGKVNWCSHSKRWWSDEICNMRKNTGRLKRKWKRRRTEEGYKEYKKYRNKLVEEIKRARREHWTNFLQDASGDNLWTVIRYTRTRGSRLIPDIRDMDGNIATTNNEKARVFLDISFPGGQLAAPAAQEEEEEGEDQMSETEEEAVRWIQENSQVIESAIKKQRNNKAPGIDQMGAPILRILWSWARERIHRLFTECIRRGVHCRVWRQDRGVIIPKPGKDDLEDCRSYRCISLLNCIGEVLERVVGGMLEDRLRGPGLIDPGQFGSLRGRSAVDAVASLVTMVEEAWDDKKIAGAICMDVKAAFPNVKADELAARLEEGGVEPCLVAWVRDFMAERSVTLCINGEDHSVENIRTGLPQRSPISPLLFAVYMSSIHPCVSSAASGVRGLSFVNDVLWLATGKSVQEVSEKLERAGKEAIQWGKMRDVEFESRKTEAILFSRNRRHWKNRTGGSTQIRLQDRTVPYNRKATRWLGVWLDSRLSWKEHNRVYEVKARKVEKRVASLVRRNGVPPISA